MLTLASLSVAAPYALIGLIMLPAIWWLLKLRPPVPARIPFPPLELLRRLVGKMETPVSIPPWLLVLRVMMVLMVTLGISAPFMNASNLFSGVGPLYIVVDDGWAAANRWALRQAILNDYVEQAGRDQRPVVIVSTAAPPGGGKQPPLNLLSAAAAKERIAGMVPRAWLGSRAASVERLLAWAQQTRAERGSVVWFSNGLEEVSLEQDKVISIDFLSQRLGRLGPVKILAEPHAELPIVLRPLRNIGGDLTVIVERPKPKINSIKMTQPVKLAVRALDSKGQLLLRLPIVFQPETTKVEAALELPTELLNRLTRLEISEANHVGAVFLVDDRWRRRPVGLVGSETTKAEQPLLNPAHYLTQALAPFAEVQKGNLRDLLFRPMAVLIIADGEPLPPTSQKVLQAWIENGGILVRFAGPEMARSAGLGDPFLPVRLRRGNRVVGGALSWGKPATLAPFADHSPFRGLSVPEDVRIRRQVLAEPSLDLMQRTWAKLSDGTPLVTAEARGGGWIVLIHTTADGNWTSLSFSGLFVEMLRRLVDFSQGVEKGADEVIRPPFEILDAFGAPGAPSSGVTALSFDTRDLQRVTPKNPPGFYGDARVRRALNLGAGLPPLRAIGDLSDDVELLVYARSRAVDLKPWLLGLGLLLFLIDSFCSARIRGLLRLTWRRALITLVVGFSSITMMGGAVAQSSQYVSEGEHWTNFSSEAFALENSLETRLAYVLTGEANVDEVSRLGLRGLTLVLRRRTAAELGEPQAIDLNNDELAFFPLLYWPVVPSINLNDPTSEKVRAYLRNGGTILFDTRDQAGDVGLSFRRLARSLSLPSLVPIDGGHVLTRSFYLLKEFPGRWSGSLLWVERSGERINDGVSPVIAGNNDWAAAWAFDEAQRPIFAVIPGGERQREMAYRFGINLVMYSLTGNYKADQVHMPAIIRRLGE